MNTLKERVWHGIRQVVKTEAGVAFKPIDAGIVSTVKALNKLGIPTTFSCYGHMAVGTDGPYIEVESPMAAKLETQLDLGKFYPLSEKYELIRNRIEELNLAEHKKLLSLVSAFYSHRESLVAVDSIFKTGSFREEDRLVINPRSFDKGRLESRGAPLLRLIGSNGIRARKLRRYRKEMEAFTAFLKIGIFLPQTKRP